MKYGIKNHLIGIAFLLISVVSNGSKVPYGLLQDQDDISLQLLDEKKAQEVPSQSQKAKRQLLRARREKFVDAYKKQFEEIWQHKAHHQKAYEVGKKAGSQNAALAHSKTAQEYIHQLMRDAYKNSLKEYYPEDEILNNPEKLQERADELIEEYLEVTCAGCCWGE